MKAASSFDVDLSFGDEDFVWSAEAPGCSGGPPLCGRANPHASFGLSDPAATVQAEACQTRDDAESTQVCKSSEADEFGQAQLQEIRRRVAIEGVAALDHGAELRPDAGVWAFRGGAGGAAATRRKRRETRLLDVLQRALVALEDEDSEDEGEHRSRSRSATRTMRDRDEVHDEDGWTTVTKGKLSQTGKRRGRGRSRSRSPSAVAAGKKGAVQASLEQTEPDCSRSPARQPALRSRSPRAGIADGRNDRSSDGFCLVTALQKLVADAVAAPSGFDLLAELSSLIARALTQSSVGSENVVVASTSASQRTASPRVTWADRVRGDSTTDSGHGVGKNPQAGGRGQAPHLTSTVTARKELQRKDKMPEPAKKTRPAQQVGELPKHWPKLAMVGWKHRDIIEYDDLEASLSDGKSLSGLICMVTSAQAMECRKLASAHMLDSIFALAISDRECPSDGLPAGSTQSWLPVMKWDVQLVWLLPLCTALPKTPFRSNIINIRHPVEDDLVTLRIALALRFMKTEESELALKSPAQYLATLLPPKSEVRAYGWTRCCVAGDDRLIGYIKTKPDMSLLLEGQSGRKAAFFTRLQADVRARPVEAVQWITKEKGEMCMMYYQRCLALSDKHAKPLALRAGGGSSLGIRGLEGVARRTRFIATGLPRSWGTSHVQQWLQDVGWSDVTNMAPPRFAAQGWLFTGAPPRQAQAPLPGADTGGSDDLYIYGPPDATGRPITIRRWLRQPPDIREVERLRHRSAWLQATPAPSVPPAAPARPPGCADGSPSGG